MKRHMEKAARAYYELFLIALNFAARAKTKNSKKGKIYAKDNVASSKACETNIGANNTTTTATRKLIQTPRNVYVENLKYHKKKTEKKLKKFAAC